MKTHAGFCYVLVVLIVLVSLCAQTRAAQHRKDAAQEAMDRDLLEVTIPQLEQLYRSHKYTVTQVVRWYMARIEKYNGIYRAVQNLDAAGALATAAREDAEAKAGGTSFVRGPLWGVPIVTKANTSIKGLITTDGWKGYMIPGHELVAPKGCNDRRKAARGRSRHPRADQHAGFCGQRYQSQHRVRTHRKRL